MASFAAASLPALLSQVGRKPDLVFCVAPAITSAVPALFYAWLTGAKSWLHIQDFEVDAALDLGILSNKNTLKKLALSGERVILTGFGRVSTISKRMVSKLESKGVAAEKIHLFPNWVDTEQIYPIENGRNPLQAELKLPSDKIIVLYAGNMGQKQGIETLLEAAKRLQNQENIHFLLCGEGAVRSELEQRAQGLLNVTFRPLQPVEKLNHLLNLADIHVLPQRADVADLVMPSKLTGMLASGKAVIATALPGTEVAEVVGAVGVVVPPEQPAELAAAIQALANDPHRRAACGRQGRGYVEAHWAYENIMQDFDQSIVEFSGTLQ